MATTGIVTLAVVTLAIGSASSRVDAQAKTNNAAGTKVAGNSADVRNDVRGHNGNQQTTGGNTQTVLVGPMGPEGPVGPMGPEGPMGPMGPEGPMGPMGPTGPTGATGADGAPGLDGATGPTGPQGLQGVQGEVGPTGTFVPAEQTLAYGTGVFTHYEDPTWVLESSNSGGSIHLRRTAPASPPNPPNEAPVNFLVFGMMHPQGCTGNATTGTASGGLKQSFRLADEPTDTLTGLLCLDGSFAIMSVQDQEKRTELRCTRISASTVVCQKVN